MEEDGMSFAFHAEIFKSKIRFNLDNFKFVANHKLISSCFPLQRLMMRATVADGG